MKKIYVGCALTQAPQEFRNKVANLKETLKKDFEILEFLGLEKGTPADVYKQDIQKNIIGCDVFVAIADYPAIGLGYEMATALEKYSKPTLALAHKDTKITRLLEGIDHPMYELKRYSSIEEIPNLIKEKAEKHFPPAPESAPAPADDTCDVCAV